MQSERELRTSTRRPKHMDLLRMDAGRRAVAELAACTVHRSGRADASHALMHGSGYLCKEGGSGLTPRHWNRRYFVLTDDNCLYYFASPKVPLLLQPHSHTCRMWRRWAWCR